jgi:hypothetical protein
MAIYIFPMKFASKWPEGIMNIIFFSRYFFFISAREQALFREWNSWEMHFLFDTIVHRALTRIFLRLSFLGWFP